MCLKFPLYLHQTVERVTNVNFIVRNISPLNNIIVGRYLAQINKEIIVITRRPYQKTQKF